MSQRLQDLPVILHNDKRGLLTVEEGRLDVLQLSRQGRPPKRLLTCPIKQFLLARLAKTSGGDAEARFRLDLHALNSARGGLHLTKLHVLVEPSQMTEAEQWVETAMQAAYGDVTPRKRVLVLVNPVGGKGKARSIVKETVLPIFEAAGCTVTMMETQHQHHAEQLAKDIALDFDVIACVGGDGTFYEVLNGLANRPDAKKALHIPLAPIPTGSACAVFINLFGPAETFNVPLACLNAVKGSSMALDLCSVLMLPSLTRRWSFISQALGLMVDLDIGTENLRWMGDTRFVLGFLKGVVSSTNYKARIRINVVEDDKVTMARIARERSHVAPATMGAGLDPLNPGKKAHGHAKAKSSQLKEEHEDGKGKGANGTGKGRAENGNGNGNGNGNVIGNGNVEAAEQVDKPLTNETTPTDKDNEPDDDGPLPDAKPLEPSDTWLTIDSGGKALQEHKKDGTTQNTPDSILYFYAGMMPWVSRDLNQWPVATVGQGVVDIAIQRVVPRATMVSAISGAENGASYWLESQHYWKAKSYIVDNLDPERQKQFTIDGEAFPCTSFHVEVVPRVAHVMSMDGKFFVSDFIKKHDTNEGKRFG